MKQDPAQARLVSAELAGGADPVHTRALLESGLAETIVADLVKLHTPESGRKEDGVDRVMVMLEHFAFRYPYEGCLLMAALYPLAANLYMHDVCDAVGLHIQGFHPAGLEAVFRHFAAEAADPHDMRQTYLEWADLLSTQNAKHQAD